MAFGLLEDPIWKAPAQQANAWGDDYGVQPIDIRRYGILPEPPVAQAPIDPIAAARQNPVYTAYPNAGGGDGDSYNSQNTSAPYSGSFDPVGGLTSALGGGGAGFGGFGGLGSFTGTPAEQAQAMDVAQKALGLGGAFVSSPMGILGTIAGEAGRQMANTAYSPYGTIGFLEDITRPDFMYGSPEDILSGLKSAQDTVIGGGMLSNEDKEGIASFLSTKGFDVEADDITDYGTIKGSEQTNMLNAQDFTPTPNNVNGPVTGLGLLDAVALENMLAEQNAMIGNIMSGLGRPGQQVSRESSEVEAQNEIAAQAAAQAAAMAAAMAGPPSAANNWGWGGNFGGWGGFDAGGYSSNSMSDSSGGVGTGSTDDASSNSGYAG